MAWTGYVAYHRERSAHSHQETGQFFYGGVVRKSRVLCRLVVPSVQQHRNEVWEGATRRFPKPGQHVRASNAFWQGRLGCDDSSWFDSVPSCYWTAPPINPDSSPSLQHAGQDNFPATAISTLNIVAIPQTITHTTNKTVTSVAI